MGVTTRATTPNEELESPHSGDLEEINVSSGDDLQQSTVANNNNNQFTFPVTTPNHSTQQPDSTIIHQTTTTTTAAAATTTTFLSTSLPMNLTDKSITNDDVAMDGIHPTSTWMQIAEDVQTSQTHSTIEESPSKFLVSLNRGLSDDLESGQSMESTPESTVESTVATDDVILTSTPSSLTTAGLPVDNPTLEHVTSSVRDAAFDKLEVDPLRGTSPSNTTPTTATTSVHTTAIVDDDAMTTMQIVATSSVGNAARSEDVTEITATPTSLTTTTTTSLTTTTPTLPTTSDEMFTNRTEVHLVSKAGTLGSPRPVDTEASPVTYSPYKPTCHTTDTAVSLWLGFPVFWWVVVAVAFVLILVMTLSCCICVMTSKRRWRKKNQQRRGYLDDQLTSSFIQTYSNPEVTPSSRNNKNGKIPPRPLKKIHKGKSSYPKSYHLGPQLLPFPADAVRLKPSSPSTPKSSDNFKNMANGRSLTEDCFGPKDMAGLKAKTQSNRDPETTFGTWRKSGVAVFGGLVPGCKRSSASNLVDADSSDKKSGKINDDEVFEEQASVGVARDVGLTTFSYKNNTNGGTTSTFKS